MRIFIVILTVVFTVYTPEWWGRPVLHSVEPTDLPAAPVPKVPPDPLDLFIFEQKTGVAQNGQDLAARTLAVAKSFLGTPYVHGTLDRGGIEQLTINLHELDCWTFMENSLAIALAAGANTPSFDTLEYFVQQLRYWGGTINGYASRMHYFSGWLLQAEKMGYLRDITRELGGIPYRNKIGYMTARPNKYPPLQHAENVRQLKQVEARLNQHPWFFIPQERVAKIEPLLREGDLIALTSRKSGLDIAHQGFAIRQNGRIHLLHASSLGKRVLLSAQPLAQYVRAQKGQSGIMVARFWGGQD